VLEFVEEALDEVALAIEDEITRQWNRTAGVGWNDRGDLPVGECFDEGIGVVGLVANQSRRIEILKQRLCTGEIVGLSWRKHQLHGVAQRIDERVDFSAQSTARPTDRLVAVFLRAPALC
jgi:hypothetical protein